MGWLLVYDKAGCGRGLERQRVSESLVFSFIFVLVLFCSMQKIFYGVVRRVFSYGRWVVRRQGFCFFALILLKGREEGSFQFSIYVVFVFFGLGGRRMVWSFYGDIRIRVSFQVFVYFSRNGQELLVGCISIFVLSRVQGLQFFL